jgi:hypothetical protein
VLVAGPLPALEPDDDDGDAGGPNLVEQALMQAIGLPLRLAGAVRHPERALGGALSAGERLVGAAASLVWPRPDTPYSGDDADDELTVAWTRLELDRLAPLLEGPGGDLDDVLASALSRALRDDLDRLGHDGQAGDADELARRALGAAAEAPADVRVDGREPRRVRPLPLAVPGAALGLAALREDGAVTIGIAAPDPAVLARELDAAVGDLLDTVAPPAPPAAQTPPAPVGPAPVVVDFDAPPGPLPGEPEPPVETPTELVAEVADAGAQDGAGAQVHVDEPWEGYGEMTADEIAGRLETATPEELAVVAMYEHLNRGRPTVVEAAERALSRR